MATRRLLLTGAAGFVGRAVRPALLAARWDVRCLTRDRARARRARPDVAWVQGDVADPAAMAAALSGCEAALYLVHGMADRSDFRGAEVEGARAFARAAGAAGLRRVVYLGGIAPDAAPTEHLQSRLDVGAALRAGPVTTVELRASMIVGHGSLSWLVVRDLAARLPVMILPRWLRSRTQPVAIDDVVAALVAALELPLLDGRTVFELPGPDVLSGKQILDETAQVLGLPPAHALAVPFLSPWLSSLWVRFVTRADWSIARHVVLGLTGDLLAADEGLWPLIERHRLVPFAEAARRALAAERDEQAPLGGWAAIERLRRTRAATG